MKEANQELVERNNREEKKPENRLKQIRGIVDNALHSVQVDYPKWRTEDLLEVALKCIDRHITEITEEEE
jgi:hypothetical protein|tara:strand:+ start:293 stop:502 length:210 start_codon:yes stop_codon:yes gene_type:complete